MLKVKKHIILVILLDCILLFAAILSNIALMKKATIRTGDSYNLKSTDLIIKIDNIEIYNPSYTELILDKYQAGDIVKLKFIRQGIVANLDYKLDNYYNIDYFIVSVVIAISFFLPAIAVIILVEDRKLALIFNFLSMSGFVISLCDWGTLSYFPNYINLSLRLISDACYLLLPIVFLHFSFLSPKPKFINLEKKFKYLYLVGFLIYFPVIYINYLYIFLFNYTNLSLYHGLHSHLLKPIIIPFFILVILNFIHSYVKTKVNSERRKILWIFVGVSFSAAIFVFLYRLPSLIFGFPIISETNMLLLQAISPILFFISVYKYQFLDIQLIVKIIIKYFIFISALILIFTGIIIILELIHFSAFENIKHLKSVLAALASYFAADKLKSPITNFVNRNFFKLEYNLYNVQRYFLSSIKSAITEKDLFNSISMAVESFIHSQNFAIIEVDINKDNSKIIKNSYFNLSENKIYQLLNIVNNNDSRLPIAKKKAFLDDINFYDETELLKDLNIEILIGYPLPNFNEFIFLVLGTKKTGFGYSNEDIDLLNYIFTESNIELQRITMQRELLFKQEQIEKLEEISKMKSFFVSSVSHELKTPLTSIKLFTEILRSHNNIPIEKASEYLGIINAECDRLNRLIENILDFSRIEKGTKEYHFEILDLNQIIKYVITIIEFNLKFKKFTSTFNISTDEYLINADKDSLVEVFINLIDNAIKYSSDVKELTINTLEFEDYYCIEFIDRGIGIGEDELDKVFSAFYRSKDTKISKTGGTGIGLSLVKNIVESHKGRIELESELGNGSCFKLYFPKIK